MAHKKETSKNSTKQTNPFCLQKHTRVYTYNGPEINAREATSLFVCFFECYARAIRKTNSTPAGNLSKHCKTIHFNSLSCIIIWQTGLYRQKLGTYYVLKYSHHSTNLIVGSTWHVHIYNKVYKGKYVYATYNADQSNEIKMFHNLRGNIESCKL